MDVQKALEKMAAAVAAGRITAGTRENLTQWLTEPPYAEFVPAILKHVEADDWKTLDDVFWTIMPFGTGGRRGRMYPIGSNAINRRTIGESAQGLADYFKGYAAEHGMSADRLRCAIVYDTRHRSREFAELCAEIMVAAGFRVFFLDGVRSTPEISFLVRHMECLCGIMVTASHNPPCDNAVKVYGPSGGQLLPPHDSGVVRAVAAVKEIRTTPFGGALDTGWIVMCQDETDRAFTAAVAKLAEPDSPEMTARRAKLRILYSPLHGVGATAVVPALLAAGFRNFSVYGPHATQDADFTNVPEHVANPERPVVFESMIRDFGGAVDLIVATDPDSDRVGFAIPKTVEPGAPWVCLTGNQAAALLTESRLRSLAGRGLLTPQHYLAKTLVTTEMMPRIAERYGVRSVRHLLVGFKYIGETIETLGGDRFVLGAEESYGYLIGDHVRDKDAAVTTLVMADYAAALRAEGHTLYSKLLELYGEYGVFAESQFRIDLPGADGMRMMKSLMHRFRESPPTELAGMRVTRTLDYLNLPGPLDGDDLPISGLPGDVVVLQLEQDGNYATIRPSGTEPLVKVYTFAYSPTDSFNPEQAEAEYVRLGKRLAAMAADLHCFAG